MRRWAHLNGGVVLHVIEQESDPNRLLVGWTQPTQQYNEDGNALPVEPEPFAPEPIYEVNPMVWREVGPEVGPDWVVDGDDFVAPPVPAADMRITVLAARQRLGDDLDEIDMFSIDDPTAEPAIRLAKARVRRFLGDLAVARFIDLAEPRVRDAVDGLSSLNLLTPARATEILDTPPSAAERPVR